MPSREYRKIKNGFLHTSEPSWDIVKTKSYVEKNISDIIQITSDLFFGTVNI